VAAAAAGLTSVVAHAAVGIARPLSPLSDTDYKRRPLPDNNNNNNNNNNRPSDAFANASGETFLRRRCIVVEIVLRVGVCLCI